MPRVPVHPAQLGRVRNLQGKFVARFQPQDFGQARDFSGPRRDMEGHAIEDFLAIRAAGEEHRTRMGALQAMKQRATRLKDEAKSEAGGVHNCGSDFRARIKYNDGGAEHSILGPVRRDESRAQADLEAIRAAAANKPTRAECLEAMQTKARVKSY